MIQVKVSLKKLLLIQTIRWMNTLYILQRICVVVIRCPLISVCLYFPVYVFLFFFKDFFLFFLFWNLAGTTRNEIYYFFWIPEVSCPATGLFWNHSTWLLLNAYCLIHCIRFTRCILLLLLLLIVNVVIIIIIIVEFCILWQLMERSFDFFFESLTFDASYL